MIHALLDSSIYRGDPLRRRLAFATLTALCEKKLVVLHVPTIVKREFTTNLVLEAEAILVEAVRSLNRLRRFGGPDNERAFVEASWKELQTFKGRYGQYSALSFDAWLRKTNAIEHKIRPECLDDVLDQYFEGELPFRTIKSREDFPDAFICQVIRDVSAKELRLSVVIEDTNLSHDETIFIQVQDSDWNESTMWVTQGCWLDISGELAISIDTTELIRKSKDGILDKDTVLYESEISVDELDTPEIVPE